MAARHRGHLIVSMLGQNQRPLVAARVITAVIGALIATMPGCCAVVWDGRVARPARLWLDMSRWSFAAFPDYPFTLWIDIQPFQSGTKIGAVTMGLSAFVGREIEFESSRLTLPMLIDKVAGLAVYLVEHGNVIKDGDTIGQTRTSVSRLVTRTPTSSLVCLCSSVLMTVQSNRHELDRVTVGSRPRAMIWAG